MDFRDPYVGAVARTARIFCELHLAPRDIGMFAQELRERIQALVQVAFDFRGDAVVRPFDSNIHGVFIVTLALFFAQSDGL